MDYVEGRVAARRHAIHVGGNWFADAPVRTPTRLQDSTVEVIAKLHSIPEPEKTFGFLDDGWIQNALRRNLNWLKSGTVRGARIGRSSLVERGLDWLEAHWPEDVPPRIRPDLGDSRVGNVLYDGFRPAAVLTGKWRRWARREMDVAWIHLPHTGYSRTLAQWQECRVRRTSCARGLRASTPSHTGARWRTLHWFYVYSV